MGASEYYLPTGVPSTGSDGDSATIRNEFSAIKEGISEKLPDLSGNNNQIIGINGGATGLEAKSASDVKSQLSLENVDNTSDADKPVSTAQAVSIGFKEDTLSAPSSDGMFFQSTVAGVKSWAFPSIGEMPTGIEVTGNIVGGDYAPNAIDPTNDIDFGFIVCMDHTNTKLISSSVTITKKADAAWAAGANNGAMLTGVKATKEDYDVYALLKDTDNSVDYGIIPYGTAITGYLPSGYSTYRYIGPLFTDYGGGTTDIIDFSYIGGMFEVANNAIVVGSATLVTGNTFSDTDFDVSALLPLSRIKRVFGDTYRTSASNSSGATFRITTYGVGAVNYESNPYVSKTPRLMVGSLLRLHLTTGASSSVTANCCVIGLEIIR